LQRGSHRFEIRSFLLDGSSWLRTGILFWGFSRCIAINTRRCLLHGKIEDGHGAGPPSLGVHDYTQLGSNSGRLISSWPDCELVKNSRTKISYGKRPGEDI